MTESKVVATRVTHELAEKIEKASIKGQYLSSAELIRDAIREKVKAIEEAA